MNICTCFPLPLKTFSNSWRRLDGGSRLLVALIVLSTPLAGSFSLDVGQALAAVITVEILDILERYGGNESRRLPSLGYLAVQFVNLLQRKTFGLVDHSPDEEDTDETASTPDEEHLSTHIGVTWARVDHVRGGVTNTEVEKPVAVWMLVLHRRLIKDWNLT